jgi:aspartate racemase
MYMKRLGIIGGLGPMATAYFLQLIIEMTDADTDQEHIEVLLHSKPQIPDRTGYILGKSADNPMPQLLEIGKSLVEQGADIIAIPCITAHFFQEELEEKIGRPIIHAIEETARYLQSEGISKVGIMATDGTVQSKLFQTVFGKYDIACYVPDKAAQEKVMHLIYKNVKAGHPVEQELFQEVAVYLFGQGAEVILLGCTELSLIKRDYPLGKGFLDVMEVLTRQVVMTCGTLKEKYQHLITE